VELVRSLRIVLGAAQALGDENVTAWALHELGTLHLAAGNEAGADRMLSEAREIRQRIGDQAGLAVTDHNLQVLCRSLRQELHESSKTAKRPAARRALLALAALGLLLTGGVAGAVVNGSSDENPPAEVSAPIEPDATIPGGGTPGPTGPSAGNPPANDGAAPEPGGPTGPGGANALADLAVTGPAVSLTENRTCEITWTLVNQGDGPAGASTTHVEPTSGEARPGDVPAPSLETGATALQSASLLKVRCGPGLTVTMTADNGDVVDESNEGNAVTYSLPPG
jgi:hypothetical protein